jgi:electron transfer flavoprotein beta subunit
VRDVTDVSDHLPEGAGRSRPLVVACLRHTDRRPDVDPVTGQVDRDPRGAGPAASEWAALELALQIAAAWDGDVLAVCAGPPDADRTLREAAAVGARVLRVVRSSAPRPLEAAARLDPLDPLESYLDELTGDGRETAAALAAGIRSVGVPDLVVCGDRSADRGSGSVPAYLAAELDAAQALGLVRLQVEPRGEAQRGEAQPGAATERPGLIGERRLDRGRRERLRIPCPAVVSVEAAGLRLRRAGMRATLAATSIPVPTIRPDVAAPSLHRGPARPFRPRTHIVAAPPGASSRDRLLALTGALVERTPPVLIRPATAAEAADALLEYLHRNGFGQPLE